MGSRVLLALGLAAVLAAPAEAATPTEAIRAAVAERLSMSVADVEVFDVELPAGAPANADYNVRLPSYGLQSGRQPLELEVIAGAGAGSWRVRPMVRLYGLVPVAEVAVAAGAPIPFRLERMALDTLRGASPVNPSLPWEARVSISAGRPVTPSLARLVPDVREGEVVPVVVRRGPLEVRCEARVEADARFGDAVPVLNLTTHTRLAGILQPDRTVLLGGS